MRLVLEHERLLHGDELWPERQPVLGQQLGLGELRLSLSSLSVVSERR